MPTIYFKVFKKYYSHLLCAKEKQTTIFCLFHSLKATFCLTHRCFPSSNQEKVNLIKTFDSVDVDIFFRIFPSHMFFTVIVVVAIQTISGLTNNDNRNFVQHISI